MNALTDSRISALQQQAGEKGVLNYTIGDGCFRINLLDDNIALWQETFAKNSSAANLLLACDKNSGDLSTTKLTWVVGSAIRSSTAGNTGEAATLLSQLGVGDELARAAAEHCPGLGEDLIWAFYLERHGWLIATPVGQVQP
jgi:myosin-crossreactive antigen